MKVKIFGAGMIGKERILAIQELAKSNDIEISSVFDVNQKALNDIHEKYKVPITTDPTLSDNPDWVFICTPHDSAVDIIKQCLKSDTNVLIEKPLGRSLEECNSILEHKNKSKLNVGFNYRFFAGIEAALNDCKEQKFGKLISVNLILGHGNAPGMEKSWKLDPIHCGGGCLIDPGVHLLDLILNMSSGNIYVDKVNSWSGIWNTGIEEEAHLLMHDDNNTIFNSQISLNKWRSTFRLEINGTEAYGIVEGRGKSYGPQSYRFGRKWAWKSGLKQIDTETIVIDKDSCDDSFIKETAAVLGINNANPCDHIGALNVMSLLEKCKNLLES